MGWREKRYGIDVACFASFGCALFNDSYLVDGWTRQVLTCLSTNLGSVVRERLFISRRSEAEQRSRCHAENERRVRVR